MSQKMHSHTIRRSKQLRHANPFLPYAAKRPQFAAKFSALHDSVIEGQGFGVDHDPITTEERPQRNDGVVNQCVRRDRLSQAAAKRVNASRRIEDRIDLRVTLTGPDLVSPIHIYIGCFADAVGVNELQLAGHSTNRRVSEVRYEVTESLGIERLTDIDEEQDLAGGMLHAYSQRGSLPAV